MIILLIVFVCIPSGLVEKDPERPNILMIVADDLGYSDIGSFGGEISTPAQASMAPGRMFKAFPTQGGIVSPLLVKTPDRMANAGSINRAFFHVRDIMPTLLDLSLVDHTQTFKGRKVRPMQGRSVLKLFEGKIPVLVAEAGKTGYELFGLKAFIDGDWKILWMLKPSGNGDWELFNLKRDPGELNNLSQQYPDQRRDMIALWEQYKVTNGVLDISMDLSRKKYA